MTGHITAPPQFPTALRKMWSGGEVQNWINENVAPLLRQHDPYDKNLVRHILRTLQEGEISTSRAMECLAGVAAGTFTYDWLPPVTAVFGMDDIPADVVRALRAEQVVKDYDKATAPAAPPPGDQPSNP